MGKSVNEKQAIENVLAEWRKLMGYSERDAVKAIGCSREAWSGWEKGDKKVPKYIGLAMAALALGMKPFGNEQAYKEDK